MYKETTGLVEIQKIGKKPNKTKKHFPKALRSFPKLHTPRHKNACTSLTHEETLKQYLTSEHGKTAGQNRNPNTS